MANAQKGGATVHAADGGRKIPKSKAPLSQKLGKGGKPKMGMGS